MVPYKPYRKTSTSEFPNFFSDPLRWFSCGTISWRQKIKTWDSQQWLQRLISSGTWQCEIMIIHDTVPQIPWNGKSRFLKNFGSELYGIPFKKRVNLQVWRDHKTINFASSVLLEVILTMWQQDLKVQYCQYQSPALAMIISQLCTPPVLVIHPSNPFWLLSIAPNTKCFYQSFFKKLHTKTLHVHVFLE